MPTKRFKLRLAATLAVALLTVACTKQDPPALMASARAYLEKKDYRAATIQLKNALDTDNSLTEARFLLGTALLQQRDGVGAELELRKAIAAGFPSDAVLPELARALLQQGKLKELITEFGDSTLDSAPAYAALKTLVAAAYAARRDNERAQASIDTALKAVPGDAEALLMQARIQAMRGDIDSALKTAEQVIAAHADAYSAMALKGDLLLYAKQQPVQALVVYQKLMDAAPKLVAGYSGALSILLGKNELDRSAELLKTLQQFAPNAADTRYFQAQLAYQKKDYKTARDELQQLLKNAPDNSRFLQLAGAVEYQAQAYVQASAFLTKALQEAPQLEFARRMLIATHLATRSPQRALDALPASFNDTSSDPELLALAGQAYLQNGDTKRAEALLARATKLDPNSTAKRTSLALAYLYGGKSDQALVELRDIARTDDGTMADTQLVALYLRRGEFDKASAAVDRMEQKLPASALPWQLRGTIQLAKQDSTAARESFEKALTIAPNFFPAAASLAQLDLADNKPDAARARFEAILKRDPKQIPALLALAEVKARGGASIEEVATLLNSAVQASPSDFVPRQALIDFYLQSNQPRLALTTAQAAVAELPQGPTVLDALGRSQQAAGEMNQAVATFKRLVALVPNSPQALMRLGGAYLADKAPDLARQTWQQVLQLQPNYLDAQRALIEHDMQAGRPKDAMAIAQKIQTQRPNEATGWLIEGEIMTAGGDWDNASNAYRRALRTTPSPVTAIKLHAAIVDSDKPADAAAFADQWLKANPGDPQFYSHLGNVALHKKKNLAAEQNYRTALKQAPSVPWVLNNLAWSLIEQKNPAALEPAQTANQLTPNQPAFMDTLANALSMVGEHAKAIDLQKKAIGLSSNPTTLKLNLAKMYIAAGDKINARTELNGVLEAGDRFQGFNEATKLKAGL